MNKIIPSAQKARFAFPCYRIRKIVCTVLFFSMISISVSAQQVSDAQEPPPIEETPDESVPFDNGVMILLGAAIAYGIGQQGKLSKPNYKEKKRVHSRSFLQPFFRKA